MQLFLFLSFAIFGLIEIILNRMFRSGAADKKEADKKSMLVLWATICISILLASFADRLVEWPIAASPVIIYASLIFLYVGIAIRLLSVYTLGKFFTVDVTIRNNHQLKKDGLFKYVRHPNYIALLLSFTGIGLAFDNWLALFVVIIPITTAFIIRINIEEKVLQQHFGDEYLEYVKGTKRLVPFIY